MLSGGERNRVHLARMLKSGANVLLLDEPTNDLDVNTLRALEEGLEDFAGCASSSATTAGSSTASPPTSLLSKATARSSVRGELLGLRGRPTQALGRASRTAAPDQVPSVDEIKAFR